MNIKTASILGGHAFSENNEVYKSAKQVSKELAKRGVMVLNGGGPGVMRASTEGAHEGGGQAMGITTYYGGMGRPNFEGVDDNNKFDKEIIAEDYFDRTERLLRMGDVHIIFKGGEGTMSEFGMTWIMNKIHGDDGRLVILVGDFWKNIMKAITENMLIKQGKDLSYHIVSDAEGCVDLVDTYRSKG